VTCRRLRRCALVVALAMGAEAVAAYGPREILDARKRLYATTYRWTDQHQIVRVTTVDAQGHEQERMVELWERRYDDGGRKVLVLFLSPDNVRGTSVLSQQRASGAPERWLYLPRQKRARRFAGQMKDEGLMGTDLTAAEIDLMHESIGWAAADVRPTLRGTERIDGVETYDLEVARAKGYERIALWVGVGDLVLRRLELYGTEPTALKRIRQSDVHFVGGVPVPARTDVETPAAGTRSVVEVVQAEFDRGFPDDVFSLPLLASPSKE
jgi:hypothetical protein